MHHLSTEPLELVNNERYPNAKHARIMIVDDDPVILKLLDKLLASEGYDNTVLIQDPREVIKRYKEERPKLVLLDINMPHMDGFHVLKQLKTLNDRLMPPVIVLTAQKGRDYLLRALSGGARDFITKPFDRTEILMRVLNSLDAHLDHLMIHDQKAALDSLVRQRTAELRKTQLQIVQRLGKASEYRDEETGNHIMRMSNFTYVLAKGLDWSEEDCELILHASTMHDVGKIGISDEILKKPGKLDPNEWEVMKRHTIIGGKLLEGDDSTLMSMAREIALTHHEWWNGEGYPNALKEEAIPRSGRIAAVADVFDALTSERPYKKIWSIGAAKKLITENSGIQFDPDIIDVFLDKLDTILEIREHFK